MCYVKLREKKGELPKAHSQNEFKGGLRPERFVQAGV
jgi:hypothetical protein